MVLRIKKLKKKQNIKKETRKLKNLRNPKKKFKFETISKIIFKKTKKV